MENVWIYRRLWGLIMLVGQMSELILVTGQGPNLAYYYR